MERVDILVNNAGVTRDMLAVRMRDEDWQAVIDLNLTDGFRLARSALRGMMRRRSGRIVSITLIVGVTGNAGQDRKSVVWGKSVHVRVDLGGRRNIKTKTQ